MGLFGIDTANSGAKIPNVPAPPTYKTRFGLEVGFEYNILPPDLSDLRPPIVRQDISTYPNRNDSFVSAMNAQRIDVLLVGIYDYQTNPKTAQEMATFLSSVATRYKGNVWGYEIINEANVSTGANGGEVHMEPSTYYDYLLECSTAIRAADPNAKIVSSGTSGVALDWHRKLAALNASPLIDFAGFHPYGANPSNIGSSIAQLADIWKKPLISTEYGSSNEIASLAMQNALDTLVHTSIFFTWEDSPSLNGYGLLDSNGARRGSYYAMKAKFAK